MSKRKLVLENGQEFIGEGFGSSREVISELVFNTSMVGYQEIFSDNSYCNQALVMTFPLIGVYGINFKDFESVEPKLDALIIREEISNYSHYEAKEDIDRYLERYNIAGIGGLDTREITRIIRETGAQLAIICDVELSLDEALAKIDNFEEVHDQVSRVSTQKPYVYENDGLKVVALDFGIKLNILRNLVDSGFDVTILPYNSSVKEIMSHDPDGIFLSNGPGDPRDLVEVIDNIKILQEKYPIFGICLGHQLISLANDCEISKMKFGHRGANHPVKNLLTNKIEITSQNHSYAVSTVNEDALEVTHINLLDQSIEGLKHKRFPVFSVQYHPESAPGPVDSGYLFTEFKDLITKEKTNA